MSLAATNKRNKTRRLEYSSRSPYVFGVLIVILIIVSTFEEVDAKGGGRGSWGGGSGRRPGGEGGLFGGLFGGGKKTKYGSSGSSYPKQQYRPTSNRGWAAAPKPANQGYGRSSGIGGGGFVAPNKGGVGRTSYGYKGSTPTFSNSYGRYGGGTSVLGNRRSSSLFGGGGTRAFAIGAGAGFLGGAMAGVAMMETYHRYRLYRSMMYGGYGYGYGGMYGGYGGFYNRPHGCFGGCPIGAFCDFGMCRCQGGYEARYGSCFNSRDSFYGRSWDKRQSPNYDPHVSCTGHKECLRIDMNSICSETTSRCECREDMKWNNETLECQVYMDVDCSDLDSGKEEKEIETQTEKIVKKVSGNETIASLDIANLTLPTYNLTETESGDYELNITTLTPEKTLAGSKLLEIDVNKTSKTEIRKEFCREIKAISLKYSEPQRVPSRYNNNYVHRRGYGGSVGSISLITLIVIACCACCCVAACYKKAKEMMNNKRGNSNAWEAPSTNDNLNVDPGNMPYPNPAYGDFGSANPQPAYPMQPTQPATLPYDPNGPVAPPIPGMPAVPPTQPGYPPGPAYPPAAPNVYPPQPQNPPYPPNPNQGVAPPYPTDPNSFGAPPYPPAPAANNPPPYST